MQLSPITIRYISLEEVSITQRLLTISLSIVLLREFGNISRAMKACHVRDNCPFYQISTMSI